MRWLTLAAVSLWTCAAAVAGDWPQWLGPNRDGSSDETVAPWKEAPRVLWRCDVGDGHSSPIVALGRVYLLDKAPNQDAERLSCWDALTGKSLGSIQWNRPAFKNPFGNGPRATPIFHNHQLIAFGVTGQLIGARVADSGSLEQTFHVDLLTKFQAKNLFFGVSASPLLVDGKILVMAGGKGAGIVALDANDGKVVWKATDDPASYASPIVIGDGDNRQAIFLTQKGLVSLAPNTGSVFWTFPFEDKLSESSTTPVKVGDRLIASSVTLGSVCLKLTEKNGQPAVEHVWKNGELSCYFSTPVSVGEHLYMVTAGGNLLQPQLNLRCVETATGKTAWSKADVGRYHAALLRTANNRLLMLDDRGHLTLIDPNPKQYTPLAHRKVCGHTWAHPALAHGRLYLRDDKELLCLELPK